MRHPIVLAGLVMLPLAAPAETARLNKCIDAHGAVTYSNLPCHSAQEARTVEVDATSPSGQRPAVRSAAPGPTAPADEPAQLKLDARSVAGKPKAPPRQCDALADKLGSILDRMDQARRHGYTQAQLTKWNEEIRTLERKKQQSGCF